MWIKCWVECWPLVYHTKPLSDTMAIICHTETERMWVYISSMHKQQQQWQQKHKQNAFDTDVHKQYYDSQCRIRVGVGCGRNRWSDFSKCSEMWQTSWQHCCRWAYQISMRYKNCNNRSHLPDFARCYDKTSYAILKQSSRHQQRRWWYTVGCPYKVI